MPARFSLVVLLTCMLLTSVATVPCYAVPLLAVDFGGTFPIANCRPDSRECGAQTILLLRQHSEATPST